MESEDDIQVKTEETEVKTTDNIDETVNSKEENIKKASKLVNVIEVIALLFIVAAIFYKLVWFPNNTYIGEYKQDTFTCSTIYNEKPDDIMKVVSYEDYLEIVDEVNLKLGTSTDNLVKTHYTDSSKNYIILCGASYNQWCTMEISNVTAAEGYIRVYGVEEKRGDMAEGSGYFVVIPTSAPVGTKVKINNQA
jgi:hypothetical protein